MDEETNEVFLKDSLVASGEFSLDGSEPSAVAKELASAALTSLDIQVFADNDRMYTIPKAVQVEAKRGLEWHKEEGRGGTSVGMNTARTLAAGGQIGIKKVRHIAKYFPRHEVDKRGKGYKPGEEGYPSNGRIAWALWGGDVAQRWASAIVERENSKSAADFDMFQPLKTVELDAFTASGSNDGDDFEFYIRLHSNGSGFDRLYRRDKEGFLSVWDDSAWSDLGIDAADFSVVDIELDSVSTDIYFHVPLDSDAAIVAAAYLDTKPSDFVKVSDLNRKEAVLAAEALSDIDWTEIDSVIAAAPPAASPVGEGKLSEIRSQAVKGQPRDAMGQFAKKGGRVNVKSAGNSAGTIQDINGENAIVKMDNGGTMTVPVAQTQAEGTPGAEPFNPVPQRPAGAEPLDTSGILGQPRAALLPPGAKLPDNTLPPLTANDIKSLMNDWPAWVADQRAQANITQTPSVHVNTDAEDHKAPNAYNDPYLRKWLDQKAKGKDGQSYYPNRSWYNPVRTDDVQAKKSAKQVGNLQVENDAPLLAAGENVAITPETSDVPPVYMAVVSPDDPQAVMDLICLVPVSTKSTKPTVFTYRNEKWQQDDKMLNDLKSPTPPPVVVLDDEALKSVTKQMNGNSEDLKAEKEAEKELQQPVAASIDEYLSLFWSASKGMLPLTAAGGLDRNRGNAEKLRRYWTHGEGAAKIRWGMPGDWSRCYRHLAKYMGPRAKGYCQLRHKEATGMYTATHAKMEGKKHFSMGETAPIWECTQISEQELQNIFNTDNFEHDELYDAVFEPPYEIVVIMQSPETILAAGGLDRNRGNAEKLRHYWTVGEGGLKIRWGTGGDWTRCVRHLSKYLGPRAKGYCALRHKEMTGLWTGDKAHRQMYGHNGKGVFAMSDEMILPMNVVVENAALRARANDARNRVLTASGGFQSPMEPAIGAKFTIPLVVPEGVETGDGRRFSKGAISMRELPLPLMWQIKTDEGHYGSVVVGRIDSMEHINGGIGNAHGVFDTGEYGSEAERLVRGGFLRGISADLDKFEADEEKHGLAEGNKKSGKILISKARVMGVTLVPKPAFQECFIKLDEESNMDAKEQDALIACASVVASIPVVPPRDWFSDPKLAGPTPLTVSEDGRVFGHIAAWHVDHIGLAMGTKPPRSRSNYAYFHTGVLRCDDGKDVPVGQLTLAGGHASLSADARAAAKHYDDTGSAFADVHAGEDAYGIWVAGSLRPEVTPQQVRAIRASAPSGDWRPIQGNLELVAVCQVNVPGFPIARARVASGQMYALVAAGASYLAQLKDDPEYLLKAAEEAKARFASLKSQIAITAGLGGCGCCPNCSAKCTGNCCSKCTINSKVGKSMHNEKEPLTVEVLERLLSDVVSFNYRVWGFHWNVTGEDFNQYHDLFGKIQDDVEGSIDPIAENIRKLGGFPPITLKEYVEESTIGEPKVEGGDPKVLVADLFAANQIIIDELKAAFTVFDQANEQAIANFISERLDMHQKWAWQLASSITEGEIILAENEDMEGAFEAVFTNLVDRGLIASSEQYGDFAYISEKTRQKAAEKGQALPDGSFPIRNVSDLKNAIHAYGRAKPAKRAAVRAHIKKRAKALGKENLIPETFNSVEIEAQELAAIKTELSARVHGMTAAAPVAPEAGVEGSPKA